MSETNRNVSGDRRRAESFGALASLYDEFRPSYPPELISWLTDAGAGVAVDVGCGTGQVARLLADAGWSVLGVEVDARMAAVAETHGVDVIVSAFEDWTPDRPFDLVCSGQAWHWVNPDLGFQRAAQALGPGGRLAVFWNSYDYEAPMRSALDAVFGRHAPQLLVDSVPLGTAKPNVAALDRDFEYRSAEWFGERTTTVFEHSRRLDVESWIAESTTHSPIAGLEHTTRSALFADLRETVRDLGIDLISVHHRTRVTSTLRT